MSRDEGRYTNRGKDTDRDGGRAKYEDRYRDRDWDRDTDRDRVGDRSRDRHILPLSISYQNSYPHPHQESYLHP